jgi:hypothetical protein
MNGYGPANKQPILWGGCKNYFDDFIIALKITKKSGTSL